MIQYQRGRPHQLDGAVNLESLVLGGGNTVVEGKQQVLWRTSLSILPPHRIGNAYHLDQQDGELEPPLLMIVLDGGLQPRTNSGNHYSTVPTVGDCMFR